MERDVLSPDVPNHDISIEDIRLVSDFGYKKQHFDGVVYGYKSTLKLKLKNVGERTFKGGLFSFNFHYAKGGRPQSGGGAFNVKITTIKPNRSKKFEILLDFADVEGNIEIVLVNMITTDGHHNTRIRGNGRLVPKATTLEEAKSEILRRTIGYASVVLIIATLVSTIAFGFFG